MIRFVANQNGNTYDFWLWDDHGATNDPTQWTNLLDGATTVIAEIATAEVLEDLEAKPPVRYQPQGPWQTFTIDVASFRCRANIGAVAKDREWIVRLTIDGTTYPQFSVRLG